MITIRHLRPAPVPHTVTPIKPRRKSPHAKRLPDWPEEDKWALCQLYPEFTATEIGRLLNRTRASVVGRANRLGLRKGNAR